MKKPRHFYNENDKKIAAWLRQLISDGHLPQGTVDERSITEINPDELAGFTQCHFFAGIGGWPYALRLAGWPEDEEVWTGSAPCQPFSIAGKRKVDSDERNLWPAFREAITICKPSIVFGEQVDSPDGRIWLAGVRADMEARGYVFGCASLVAAGVGSPHNRPRIYWVAFASGNRRPKIKFDARQKGCSDRLTYPSSPLRLGESNGTGRDARESSVSPNGHGSSADPTGGSFSVALGDTDLSRPQGYGVIRECAYQWPPGTPNQIVFCQDYKWRRIKSGIKPLASRLPAGMVPIGDPSLAEVEVTQEARTARLKGYGNAIIPQLAAQFILASVEAVQGLK